MLVWIFVHGLKQEFFDVFDFFRDVFRAFDYCFKVTGIIFDLFLVAGF